MSAQQPRPQEQNRRWIVLIRSWTAGPTNEEFRCETVWSSMETGEEEDWCSLKQLIRGPGKLWEGPLGMGHRFPGPTGSKRAGADFDQTSLAWCPASCCFRATQFRKKTSGWIFFPCVLTQELGLTCSDPAAAQRRNGLTFSHKLPVHQIKKKKACLMAVNLH